MDVPGACPVVMVCAVTGNFVSESTLEQRSLAGDIMFLNCPGRRNLRSALPVPFSSLVEPREGIPPTITRRLLDPSRRLAVRYEGAGIVQALQDLLALGHPLGKTPAPSRQAQDHRSTV
jgi:hypothetical protein